MTDNMNQSVQSAEDGTLPHTVDEAVKIAEAEEAQSAEQSVDVENTSIDELMKMDPGQLAALLDKKEPTQGADTVPAAEADTQEGGEPQGDNRVTMIPKPRFDEVLSDRNKLAEENAKLKEEKAFLSGVTVGAKVTGQPTQEPTSDPLKEVAQKLEELDATVQANITATAAQFDNGDITLADFEKKKLEIHRNAKTIQNGLLNRRERIITERNKPSPEQQLQNIESDPDLVAATKGLIQENPWFANVPDENYEELAQLAQIRLVKQGIPIRNDAETQWNIRWTMAEIGKQFGYDRVYGGGGNPSPAQPPKITPATKPGYTPTPEQKAAKRELERNTPPAPTLGGQVAPVKIGSDEIDVDSMSVEELSKLPASVLQKLSEKSG